MSTDRERLDEIGKKIKREADNIVAAIDRSATRRAGPTGTLLNTVTPCAACKLLRRRCTQECPFSPYFSPHEPQKFASVHKVFGASNVSKMLMEVPEAQRADAANSLVYEANLRLRDPVYGCMGAISALQQQVQMLETELQVVRNEIMKHKYRQQGGAFESTVLANHSPLVLPHSSDVSVAVPMASIPALPPSSTSTVFSSMTNSENIPYFV